MNGVKTESSRTSRFACFFLLYFACHWCVLGYQCDLFVVLKARYQFFCLQLVQNVTMAVGPISQYHQNSKYYSARPPRPNKQVDNNLPHITIQMPVYKEGLEAVLYAPFISSYFLPLLKLFYLSCN